MSETMVVYLVHGPVALLSFTSHLLFVYLVTAIVKILQVWSSSRAYARDPHSCMSAKYTQHAGYILIMAESESYLSPSSSGSPHFSAVDNRVLHGPSSLDTLMVSPSYIIISSLQSL